MPNYTEIFILNTIYTLPKPLFTWVTQFCVITYHPTYLFLTYTTHINLVLWSNLRYKKLLKVVNTSSFLRTNLIYKKTETVLIAKLICFWLILILFALTQFYDFTVEFKKLLEYVNTTNFLQTNLKCKKAENFLILPPYLVTT